MQTIEETREGDSGRAVLRRAERYRLGREPSRYVRSDSLDLIEISMTAEDEFSIEIPDDTMWQFKTGQQIVDYLKEKVPA